MAKRKPNPLAAQAQNLTLVRYGPEVSALKALLRQAALDRTQAIQGARSSAALVQSAVDQSRPDVRANYRGAGRTAATQQALVTPAIVGTGTPFAAAAQIESSGLKSQLASSRAQDLSDLDRRRIAAAEGASYARTAAERTYTQTSRQIGQRARDLANESGAFTASTLQTLISDRASARAAQNAVNARLTQQERDSIRSAGMNPDQPLKGGGYAPIPGGRLDPKAPKNQPKPDKPTTADRAAATDYGKALSWLGSLDTPAYWKKLGHNDPKTRRDALKEILLKGARDQGIPAIPQAILAAALDTHFQKYLSQNTVRLLHQQGYKVKYLPDVTTTPVPSPADQARQRVAAAPNNWIKQIAAALGVG